MINKIAKLFACFLFLPTIAFCQQMGNTFLVDFSWGKEVIEHYRNSEDQEKLKATYFLVESMSGHCSPASEALHRYITKVNTCKISGQLLTI